MFSLRLDNKSRMSGDVQVRFCESLRVRFPRATRRVICCPYNRDAERIKKALAQRQGIKQETFDFLGFTLYLGKSRKGFYLVNVKTVGKRFNAKLKKTNDWARSIRNKTSLKHIIKVAASKVRGTFNIMECRTTSKRSGALCSK